MFSHYIGDINEFPALGSSSPQKPKTNTNKPTYASTTATGSNRSSLPNNRGLTTKKSITPDLAQRFPSSSSSPLTKKNSNQNFCYADHIEPQGMGRSGNENAQPSHLGHNKKDDINSNRSPPPPSVQNEKEEQYGLMGLLGVLRMISGDKSMLALGSDLSTLGLNLNMPNELYTTFLSPWADTQATPRGVLIEPGFYLPQCYQRVLATPSALERIAAFSDETLFYTFYSTPRDLTQVTASIELQKRNWRFNKELGLWITRSPGSDDNSDIPFKKPESGELSEHGVFTFFDPEKWEKVEKEWVVQWDVMAELNVEEECLSPTSSVVQLKT